MIPLEIKNTRNTPSVLFNETGCSFALRGISTMADAKAFYQPVIEWILNEENVFTSNFVFEFHLPYFNSGTHKCLYHLIEAIASRAAMGQTHHIVWCVEDDDEFMKEGGEALEEISGVRFDYKQVPFSTEQLF
ncbi:MAG: SiaC family regulatory phosphoprotein [Flavobacteriales bacterium]